MSKGDWKRPVDPEKFGANYDRIFGPQKLNLWEDDNEQAECPPSECSEEERGAGQAETRPVHPPEEDRGDSGSGGDEIADLGADYRPAGDSKCPCCRRPGLLARHGDVLRCDGCGAEWS